MHLSSIYQRIFWVLVYHTEEDSSEVELITNRLFLSKEKALKWFYRKRNPDSFIQPEAIMLTGFNKVTVQREVLAINHVMPHKVDTSPT